MSSGLRAAGGAIADWIAPERSDLDALMSAVEAEELATGVKVEPLTLQAIKDFVVAERADG